MADAVVIGSGPNGLVAANRLADEGWDVVVLEAAPTPGGAVRSEELVERGYVNDVFSAFYPLGVASPHIGRYGLEEHGLRWRSSPLAFAHPGPDGTCAAVGRSVDETAALLGPAGPGWRRLHARWERVGPDLVAALMQPFPPVKPGLSLARKLIGHDPLGFARFAMLSLRRLVDEEFDGPEARAIAGRLLGGNALHTDLAPDGALSGLFGWLLASLGQDVGFPAPEGGAGSLTAALVNRLESKGGKVRCGAEATRVVLRRGRAVAVRTADGDEHAAAKAVLADVGAPSLYLRLVGTEHLTPRIAANIERFHWDQGTVKVDWTLDGPIPWEAEPARQAGTVHLADDLDFMGVWAARVAGGELPERPYVVLGQYSMVDPTRQPAGKETAWGYTHVPRGRDWSTGDGERTADRIEAEIERRAPGFCALVRRRHVMAPPDLEARNANLVGGAIGAGSSHLDQQLVFRPLPGLARAETPFAGLFLASAAAHPGAGVHGACGANAARAALLADRHPRAARALRPRGPKPGATT